jgi:hypothetical protein
MGGLVACIKEIAKNNRKTKRSKRQKGLGSLGGRREKTIIRYLLDPM